MLTPLEDSRAEIPSWTSTDRHDEWSRFPSKTLELEGCAWLLVWTARGGEDEVEWRRIWWRKSEISSEAPTCGEVEEDEGSSWGWGAEVEDEQEVLSYSYISPITFSFWVFPGFRTQSPHRERERESCFWLWAWFSFGFLGFVASAALLYKTKVTSLTLSRNRVCVFVCMTREIAGGAGA